MSCNWLETGWQLASHLLTGDLGDRNPVVYSSRVFTGSASGLSTTDLENPRSCSLPRSYKVMT